MRVQELKNDNEATKVTAIKTTHNKHWHAQDATGRL